MPVESIKISRKEPVHFRVVSVGPHPLPNYADKLELAVEYLNHPTAPRSLMVSPSEFELHGEAIRDAIASQAVYEVSWDYPDVPEFLSKPKDSTLDRLLNAIIDRKIVSGDSPQ